MKADAEARKAEIKAERTLLQQRRLQSKLPKSRLLQTKRLIRRQKRGLLQTRRSSKADKQAKKQASTENKAADTTAEEVNNWWPTVDEEDLWVAQKFVRILTSSTNVLFLMGSPFRQWKHNWLLSCKPDINKEDAAAITTANAETVRFATDSHVQCYRQWETVNRSCNFWVTHCIAYFATNWLNKPLVLYAFNEWTLNWFPSYIGNREPVITAAAHAEAVQVMGTAGRIQRQDSCRWHTRV